jgi:SAM-dependent methyltransferase
MSTPGAEWAIALTRRSVLKQAKIRELTDAIGPIAGEACLDIGGDNGAVSAILRSRGGRWASADLGDRNIASIREVVGGDVRAIEGSRLPFESAAFDLVVIVDLLEHVEDDRELVRECARVLRPGGTLVVNVPHVKKRSLINAARHAVGLTDAWHGHLRPGYTIAGLSDLLAPDFRIEMTRTYSRAFSETIDLVMNAVFEKLRGPKSAAPPDSKGPVVTSTDVAKHGTAFRLLGITYPFLYAFSRLDALMPFQPGYKLIVRARHVPSARRAA